MIDQDVIGITSLNNVKKGFNVSWLTKKRKANIVKAANRVTLVLAAALTGDAVSLANELSRLVLKLFE